MPIRMSVRALRSPLVTRATSAGVHQQAETPDPNDAMSIYARGQEESPGADSLGTGLQQRGMEARRAADLENATAISPMGEMNFVRRPMSTVLPDPQWEGFFQALKERGVDRLSTGAAAGIGNPGFFDTQKDTPTYKEKLAQEGIQFNGFGRATTPLSVLGLELAQKKKRVMGW